VCDTPHQEQLETVTFHPSFSYEDFIEGLTAQKTDDGDVAYEVEAGVFKRVAERAREAYQESPDNPSPYVLIIDEINRGNLAQIFGETITGLERDKRLGADNEARISLAHSRHSFTVPPNLYVIGTMNTADRSIALVDAALRRRFRFISFPPNYEALAHHHEFASMDSVEQSAATSDDSFQRLLALSILAIRKLNTRILDAPDLGKGKQIGHSFLWDIETESDLCTVWQFEILPLLEEYYFGQFDRIREELFRGSGDELYDFEREEIQQIIPSRLANELTSIVNLDASRSSTETTSEID
jgi:5-methylcytosine-specific restriction protein B